MGRRVTSTVLGEGFALVTGQKARRSKDKTRQPKRPKRLLAVASARVSKVRNFELKVGFPSGGQSGGEPIPLRGAVEEFRAEGGIFRRRRIRRPPPADNQAENPSRFEGRLRNFELKVGFEPTTCGLRNRCSTAELLQQTSFWHIVKLPVAKQRGE
jgi:hypothetical protein